MKRNERKRCQVERGAREREKPFEYCVFIKNARLYR